MMTEDFTNDPCRWQARRASNPQPSVLETDALPIELLACILRKQGQKSGIHQVTETKIL
jgi:hypothetical protein